MKHLIAAISVLLSLVACTHKELCYDHPHTSNLSVRFDWSTTPEKVPQSMSVYFFKERSKEPLRFEFTDYDGGRIRLTAGTYNSICVNSDERNLLVQNSDRFESFYVTTKEVSSMGGISDFGITTKNIPRAKGSEDQRIVEEPNSIWFSNARDIQIGDRTEQDLSLSVIPRIINYNIEIQNAENLKWVYGATATISGMVGGFYPATGELSDEKVTIPFETRLDKESSTISGSFTSFGYCQSEDDPHYLKVYAVLSDDSWWDFTYDITELIHDSEETMLDKDTVSLVLKDLPIPKPVANGGGFKPTVGEWNSVEIELKM